MTSKNIYVKHKLIYGVATNDADYAVTMTINGKRTKCKIYETWANMLLRCYNKSYLIKKPTYEGCSVCSEWLTFSNFKSWMEKQDWQGKTLDKDYISVGNKVYSPDTCIFVTQQINSFISSTITKRKSLSCGVFFDSEVKKFYAKCSDPFSKKNINIGYFLTEAEACREYLFAKSAIANKLADICNDEKLAIALRARFQIKTHTEDVYGKV